MPATITPALAWTLLLVAGALEIVWVMTMKASAGFTRPPWVVATLITAGLSFWLLGLSMKVLPAGTAYAVWTGIGAVGAVTLGIVIFGEAMSALRLGCVALIVAGILGLKFVAPQ
jgi:quaternary ammonium compound-resistance protein SugE